MSEYFTDEVVVNERGGGQSKTPVRMDLVPPDVLLAVAKVLADGADKYGENNWKKIDTSDHVNHALAHLVGYLSGDTSEQHLLNAVCRTMFAAHTDKQASVSKTNAFVESVKEFNHVYCLPTEDYINTDISVDELFIRLIGEEFEELKEAVTNNIGCHHSDIDIAPVQDALGDLLYVVIGTAVRWGFDIEGIFNEIHRSNMSKLGADGKPIYREDGKLLKGPNYSAPTLGKKFCINITEAV